MSIRAITSALTSWTCSPQRNNITLARLRCKAVVGEGAIAGQRVALALPQTYMNLSGESVVQLVNWYKPERDQLIVLL